MTAEYNGECTYNRLFPRPTNINAGIYNHSSRESLTSSPLDSDGYDDMPYEGLQYSCPVQEPALAETAVEPDIKEPYEDRDDKRNHEGRNLDSPDRLSRRRAQNRVAQRAFRARQKMQTRDLEEKFVELQEQHNALIKSYTSLKLEYETVKRELESLRRSGGMYERVWPLTRSYEMGTRSWMEFKTSSPFGEEEEKEQAASRSSQPLTQYIPPAHFQSQWPGN